MVDWSGSDRRRAGVQDCIWIAHGPATATAPITVSPPSRTEAEQIIRAQLQPIVAARKRRVLLCADFGYGYPAGFASLLPTSSSSELPPWRIVWHYLGRHVQDDLGTKPGQRPTNRSNRFEIASTINAAVSSSASHGPVWCLFKAGGYACVPQKKPLQPFVCASGTIASLRITDRRAKSDTPFRLFGTGSVGSQVLTGTRDSRASGLIPSSPDAPLFGLSRPAGRPRPAYGSTRTCGFCTPRFIPASEHPSPIPSRTAVRCAPCGIGRVTSTQRIYSSRNLKFHRASPADHRRMP